MGSRRISPLGGVLKGATDLNVIGLIRAARELACEPRMMYVIGGGQSLALSLQLLGLLVSRHRQYSTRLDRTGIGRHQKHQQPIPRSLAIAAAD